MEMLQEKERQELKVRNLNLINDWVKEFCSDGSIYTVEHVFQRNGRDHRISASKHGIGVCSYGKFSHWCHVNDKENPLEDMASGTELICHWQEVKAQLIAAKEQRIERDKLFKDFTV